MKSRTKHFHFNLFFLLSHSFSNLFFFSTDHFESWNSCKEFKGKLVYVKIVVAGPSKSGKTNLIHRMRSANFVEDHVPTLFNNLGVDYTCKKSQEKFTFGVWDSNKERKYQKFIRKDNFDFNSFFSFSKLLELMTTQDWGLCLILRRIYSCWLSLVKMRKLGMKKRNGSRKSPVIVLIHPSSWSSPRQISRKFSTEDKPSTGQQNTRTSSTFALSTRKTTKESLNCWKKSAFFWSIEKRRVPKKVPKKQTTKKNASSSENELLSENFYSLSFQTCYFEWKKIKNFN